MWVVLESPGGPDALPEWLQARAVVKGEYSGSQQNSRETSGSPMAHCPHPPTIHCWSTPCRIPLPRPKSGCPRAALGHAVLDTKALTGTQTTHTPRILGATLCFLQPHNPFCVPEHFPEGSRIGALWSLLTCVSPVLWGPGVPSMCICSCLVHW